jgi:transcriptional adapter 2-alpha
MPQDHILPEVQLPAPPEFDTAPRESRPSIAHERNMAERNKKEKTTPAEFAGWMPRRLEFEVEYLNDAEQIISGMTFSDKDDTATTLDQKLAALRSYNEKLEERHIRTRFALDWELLDHEFRSFGSRSKSEREMEEALMPLAQVVPRETLTHLIYALQNEMRLKEQIEQSKRWRRNGIVTRDEGILFSQLESLMNEDKLSAAAVEKWNRDVMLYAESPEFRATLDRQLLNAAENRVCQSFGLSPHSYLRIKDLLLREFTARGEMTRELALSCMPGQEQVMVAIYESLKNSGLFYDVSNIGKIAEVAVEDDGEIREEDSITEEREDTPVIEEGSNQEYTSTNDGSSGEGREDDDEEEDEEDDE